MNPGTFVTLMILGWLLLAGVTLWAFMRVPMRRARLQQRSHGEAEAAHVEPLPQAPATPGEVVARKRHGGWLAWSHR
ncbi:hypothetical protein [Pseudomonas citronellolis]|uniref:hypothetical protein n=1 Tax=Pseudomonas citronellolis TaxID=53408 RepID=UPI0023E3E3D4|nr:hypothetical protein [Pseudomonas citronellolis]MDF3936193.1 hypothetical protein [Pseudomonas citronellolis]